MANEEKEDEGFLATLMNPSKIFDSLGDMVGDYDFLKPFQSIIDFFKDLFAKIGIGDGSGKDGTTTTTTKVNEIETKALSSITNLTASFNGYADQALVTKLKEFETNVTAKIEAGEINLNPSNFEAKINGLASSQTFKGVKTGEHVEIASYLKGIFNNQTLDEVQKLEQVVALCEKKIQIQNTPTPGA